MEGRIRSRTASSSPHEALNLIQAPLISNEDFTRLYKGRLAEIVDLVAQHVVGRSEANAARALIQHHREASTKIRQRLEDDTDPLYTAARSAESRLKTARIAADGTRRAHEEHMVAVRDLAEERGIEREERQLQSALEQKRITILLLSILERKEKIRQARVAEIARILGELRLGHSLAKLSFLSGSPHFDSAKASGQKEVELTPRSAVPAVKMITSPVRAEHTRDSLAALQAHQIRVTRLAAHSKDPSSEETQRRLLDAVARSLGTSSDDPKTQSAFQQLLSACKSQARRAVQYTSPLPLETADVAGLPSLSLRIKGKEDELQELADYSAALTIACAQALQTVTHFVKETSPALHDGLRDETAGAQGHIDVLRLSIVNRPSSSSEGSPQSLNGGQSFVATLENIRSTVSQAHALVSFLEANTLLSQDVTQTRENDGLITAYTHQEAELTAKLKRLLDRKGKKTEAGRVLIQDIERLIAEVGVVASGHI
ncbi:hypothetical protein C8Q76DRAFT_691322 [Earliella scabrosa]|nr:hypothetical protein C8Q76DRAFT_691322 [Earliella scabrosa]